MLQHGDGILSFTHCRWVISILCVIQEEHLRLEIGINILPPRAWAIFIIFSKPISGSQTGMKVGLPSSTANLNYQTSNPWQSLKPGRSFKPWKVSLPTWSMSDWKNHFVPLLGQIRQHTDAWTASSIFQLCTYSNKVKQLHNKET